MLGIQVSKGAEVMMDRTGCEELLGPEVAWPAPSASCINDAHTQAPTSLSSHLILCRRAQM